MKIALVDNMNNNFFAFARYLRDFGIDAYIYEIPNSSLDHFSYKADTFIFDNKKPDWILDFPVEINLKNWIFFNKKKIISEFIDYDLVVSCGYSSAYLKRAGINSDIIIPYGGDLYGMFQIRNYFDSIINSLRSIRAFIYIYAKLFYYQKKAYKDARVIITNLDHKIYKNAINSLSINAINYGLPALYNLEKVEYIPAKFEFLKNHDFILFNHSRQIWCSNPDNFADFDKFKGNKRNDKTIKAFAEFLKVTNFKSPVLVLFEYGPDVKCSKALIEKLNIEKFVKWIEKSYRKEILLGLKQASLAVDQVRENINGIGGTSYEVLASGVPLLTHTDGALKNKNSIFYNSPIIEVLNENDILGVFIDYERNKEKYKEIGRKSKKWFDENLGIGLVKKYLMLIELLKNNKELTQNDNIVRDIFL